MTDRGNKNSGDPGSAPSRVAITEPVAEIEPTESESDADFSVEEDVGDPGSLMDRVKRPQTLISFALAIFIIVFFLRRVDISPSNVWSNIKEANVFLYVLAFAPFYLGFILRAERWRAMLARAGITEARGFRVPKLFGLIEIYLLSWFANCVVPAKLGDAYRSYLLKRASKAPFSTSLGTILAERLTDLVVLVGFMFAMGLVVFGNHQPDEARTGFIGGAALVLVGAVGVAVMWTTREALLRRIPHRFRDQYARLHDGVFASLRRPYWFLLISVVVWFGEGLRLYLVCLALGADVSISSAIFVALLSSLLTALPITPAGLGIVETTMIAVFRYLGVDADMAASIALLDRVIGYWSIVTVGLILYVRRVRRELAVVEDDLELPAPEVGKVRAPGSEAV